MVKRIGAINKLTTIVVSLVVVFISLSPVNSYALSITKENVIELTNQSRVDNGVSRLVENPKLTQAAQAKADDMIKRQYWAHYYNGEKPWDWMKKADYKYIQAGENLAIDFTDASNMNQAWLNSESHRKNMLNPNYQDIGIGIASGWFKDHNSIIVVQMFGRTTENIAPRKKVFSSNVDVSADSTSLETEQVDQGGNWFIDLITTIGSKINYFFNLTIEGFGRMFA